MIGKHYSLTQYNCAHFLAEWYKVKLDIEIPVFNEFEMSFLRWMRHNFKQVQNAEENCLVYMHRNHETHIGVYADYGVYHNYKPERAHGAVVHWPLGVVLRNYEKVTYWVWSK